MKALGELLRRKSAETGRIIYLVSDEPYRRIVYDGVRVAPVMAAYENTIIASSYSKELSLAGERIGYVAANPAIARVGELMAGLVMANRILGFVNAPALMQRVVARLQGVTVDVAPYQRNRDVLCEELTKAGFTVSKPEGAFYLFPKSPHGGRHGLLPGAAGAAGAGGAGQWLRPARVLPHGLLRGAVRWSIARCRRSGSWGPSTSGRRERERGRVAALRGAAALLG